MVAIVNSPPSWMGQRDLPTFHRRTWARPAPATFRARFHPELWKGHTGAVPPTRRTDSRAGSKPTEPPGLFVLFLLSLTIIGGISFIDAALNVVYPVTAAVEENPLAAAILRATHDSVAVLMVCKAAGTLLVLGALVLYSRYKYVQAVLIAAVVAAFQLLVLGYLLAA
jgi:hypothetical protein